MDIKNPLMVALYLPQFYETEYNNEWWGKGYTEWTACKQAKPLFKGHNQPRVPLNNNYYDLSIKDNIKWQMNLAREYGLDGFAIYQYYSCGKKLLEVPTEIIRDNADLDLPFFLFWANESWKMAWYGQSNKVVWKQEYGTEEDWYNQFLYCLTFFKDSRYMRLDGKPIYVIYHASDFKEIDTFIAKWNQWAIENGLPGIYFVKTLGSKDSTDLGSFSSVITREPVYAFAYDQGFVHRNARRIKTRVLNVLNKTIFSKSNRGFIRYRVSYDKTWKGIINRRDQVTPVIYGAFTGWDTTPRRGYNGILTEGASPEKFGKYLSQLYKKAKNNNVNMIVINAWNEWAEGAYLEPDEHDGYKYLEKIKELKNQMLL